MSTASPVDSIMGTVSSGIAGAVLPVPPVPLHQSDVGQRSIPLGVARTPDGLPDSFTGNTTDGFPVLPTFADESRSADHPQEDVG